MCDFSFYSVKENCSILTYLDEDLAQLRQFAFIYFFQLNNDSFI